MREKKVELKRWSKREEEKGKWETVERVPDCFFWKRETEIVLNYERVVNDILYKSISNLKFEIENLPPIISFGTKDNFFVYRVNQNLNLN